MLIPRRIQLEQANDLQCFHLWSPVVPGLAALARVDLKKWVAKLLRRLSGAYAVKLQGFSIEADQFHLILQWVPGAAAQWSDDEAQRRWLTAHPAAGHAHDPGMGPPVVSAAKARLRLASLSAFLQQFKQLITFKFNRETKHKGTIWKGRFRLAALQDASALAGALSFVDLLPVAKDGGQRPEESPFSSLHARVALYKGKFGTTPYGPLAEPEGLWQPFPPEVAAELREGEEPAAPPVQDAPAPVMPPVTMPGMEPMPMMPPVDMPGMGMGMGGMPQVPMAPPEMPPMPVSADGSWAGEPAAPMAASNPWVRAALREDGPGGVLSWLSLRRYLRLLDTLVAKAKAWPHLPAGAWGRAPTPPTPAWENAAQTALSALGLDARGFISQWQRLARLRA